MLAARMLVLISSGGPAHFYCKISAFAKMGGMPCQNRHKIDINNLHKESKREHKNVMPQKVTFSQKVLIYFPELKYLNFWELRLKVS